MHSTACQNQPIRSVLFFLPVPKHHPNFLALIPSLLSQAVTMIIRPDPEQMTSRTTRLREEKLERDAIHGCIKDPSSILRVLHNYDKDCFLCRMTTNGAS
jgi:hypothetical protein